MLIPGNFQGIKHSLALGTKEKLSTWILLITKKYIGNKIFWCKQAGSEGSQRRRSKYKLKKMRTTLFDCFFLCNGQITFTTEDIISFFSLLRPVDWILPLLEKQNKTKICPLGILFVMEIVCLILLKDLKNILMYMQPRWTYLWLKVIFWKWSGTLICWIKWVYYLIDRLWRLEITIIWFVEVFHRSVTTNI